jgi:hypothetical protein
MTPPGIFAPLDTGVSWPGSTLLSPSASNKRGPAYQDFASQTDGRDGSLPAEDGYSASVIAPTAADIVGGHDRLVNAVSANDSFCIPRTFFGSPGESGGSKAIVSAYVQFSRRQVSSSQTVLIRLANLFAAVA